MRAKEMKAYSLAGGDEGIKVVVVGRQGSGGLGGRKCMWSGEREGSEMKKNRSGRGRGG